MQIETTFERFSTLRPARARPCTPFTLPNLLVIKRGWYSGGPTHEEKGMSMPKAVRFVFNTGISRPVFSNVSLSGSWDSSGNPSANWSSTPMQAITGTDGCPAFEATVNVNGAGASEP
jgi:hypothetical protein